MPDAVTATRWGRRVAAAGAVWLLVAVGAWILGNEPRPGLLALVVATGAGVVWLFLDVSADAEVATWPRPVDEPVRPPGEDPRLALLHRVVSQHQDAHDVGDALFRHLAELADRRLVAQHGVSLRADPDRAAGLLGPELTAVVTARPPYPRLTTEQIDLLIQRIEAL